MARLANATEVPRKVVVLTIVGTLRMLLANVRLEFCVTVPVVPLWNGIAPVVVSAAAPFTKSVLAVVASVPDVGNVTLVAPVVVSVIEFAPEVTSVLPSASVSVAPLAGAVTATLFNVPAVVMLLDESTLIPVTTGATPAPPPFMSVLAVHAALEPHVEAAEK